eukprot:CAMPEP_0194093566 /NCGR_PEP_ID=MMETSP0149-20130528/50755_1 /TAXON_ID=122233 /ORGANISM="Chaetoceros debilis, Strain MM31A-1" /LENGTH=205 /DNA_ID=CAMNT_0038778907 /DNA_START=74 /DNA_END=691 /DNA_ORIENTATION=-
MTVAATFSLSSLSSQMKSHHRILGEAWEGTKEAAGDTYEGLKNTVQQNMVISITLAVTVCALLILCCYLTRKCRRDAQVITQKQYKELVASRQDKHESMTQLREKRTTQKKRTKEKSKLRRFGRKGKENDFEKELQNLDLESGDNDNKNGNDERNEDFNHANTSLDTTDTRDTSISREDVDIEVGDDGEIEIEFSPQKVSRGEEI